MSRPREVVWQLFLLAMALALAAAFLILPGCGTAIFNEKYPPPAAVWGTTQPSRPQASNRTFVAFWFGLDNRLDHGQVKTPEGGSVNLSGASSSVDAAMMQVFLDAYQAGRSAGAAAAGVK